MSGFRLPTIPTAPLLTVAHAAIKRYKITPEDQDEPEFTSYLSTPVWSNLIFSPEGVDVGFPTTIDPDAGKEQLRIDTVLFTVEMPKNIVKTAIQGRNGTVKEYISNGDYMVNIKGAIVSPFPLVFPREDVDLLIRYCQLNTQIPVISFFLDLFGITSVVIERYVISEKLGSRNEVPFEIDAVSDRPLEFQLNPNKGI